MVQVDRKEVCDFLNEKADTITLFVQKHKGLENVENVSFIAQGTKAYCTLKWNGSAAGLPPMMFSVLRDVFRKLGVELHDDDTSQDVDLLMYEVLFFEARSVTVWRSYTVTKAEAALRCLPPMFLSNPRAAIDDEWHINENIEVQVMSIADEEHCDDQIYGCEYESSVLDNIIEF